MEKKDLSTRNKYSIGAYTDINPKITFLIEYNFWSKVEINSLNTDCWIWKGSKSNNYGGFRVGEITTKAHVFSYWLHFGKVPKGKELHHICENKMCVNPNHLKPVTHLENMLFTSKTHCSRGHEFSQDNVYINPRGNRVCIKCTKLRVRRFKLRNK